MSVSLRKTHSYAFPVSMAGALAVLMFNALPAFLGAAAVSYGFDNAQLGYMAAAYFAGHTLMTVVAGFLLKRIPLGLGSRIAALLAAGAFLSMLWLDSYEQLVILLTLAGLGGGTLFVIVIATLSAGERATRDIGLCYFLQMLTGALLVYLSPIFIVPNWGAQGLLVVYGIGFVVVAWMSSVFSQEALVRQVKRHEMQVSHGWKFQAMPVVILVGILVHFIGFAALWGFLEIIGSRAGHAPDFIGTVLMGSLLGGAVGAMFTIRLENRYGLRLPFLIANLGLLTAIVLLWRGAHIPALYAVGVIALNAFDVFVVNTMFAGVAARDKSGDHAPLAPATQGIGIILGPAIGGAISGVSFAPLMLLGLGTITLVMLVLVASPVLKGIGPGQEPHSP